MKSMTRTTKLQQNIQYERAQQDVNKRSSKLNKRKNTFSNRIIHSKKQMKSMTRTTKLQQNIKYKRAQQDVNKRSSKLNIRKNTFFK